MIDTGLDRRRIVVCCGAGGVGKTTVSAALGLGLAKLGHRTAVVTIDPAKRLATALGMADLGDEPTRVSHERMTDAGLSVPGELWALQLDAKATFDRLVAREAPTEEAREEILQNRIYAHLSGAVAGAQEYMAVERLHELVEDGRFERIVLDTPPSQNALDFLEAPERITRFLEGKALRLLLRPAAGGGIARRALQIGGNAVLSVLERLTGAQMLRDISEFLGAFEGMYEGFSRRADEVRAMLRSEDTGFVVVTAPAPEPTAEAVALVRQLTADDYPLEGVVLNRIHGAPPADPVDREALREALRASGAREPDDLAGRAVRTLEELRAVAARDGRARDDLTQALGAPPIGQVPALEDEPVDLHGLARVTAALRT